MEDKFRNILMNNRKLSLTRLLLLLIIILSLIIVVPKTFFIDTSKKDVGLSSEKANFDKKEAGAWNVTKSAKWTAKGEAEITFDVDTVIKQNNKYTDIIFVLDVSGSMNGEKLDRVKVDTIELINSLLSNDKNRAGLITFETNSQIISNLTNDKEELIEKVNALTTTGTTNYYQALVNVDTILKKYVKEDDRECVVLFLTDGYPNEDIPNEEMQYSYLKNQYPFITVNGVQYEMGSNILEPVKKVSDNQYIADMETLNNVLFDASVSPVEYDNFMITDYIDTNYFYVESEKDIKVRQGTITFDKGNQKVTWNIENFKSGTKSKMIIKIKLKEELVGVGSTYPTNEKEDIKSKLDDITEDVMSTETPVLKDNYKVIYDGNAPAGCRVEGAPEEKQHTVFDVVGLSASVPKCKGYQFKGWKIITKNIDKISNDYFIMPEADVTIKANWGKVDISKLMDGKVQKRMTLYEQVKEDYENNNYARLYTGDTSTFKGDEKVYYYNGDSLNNNVIFGGFCWQMYRTTDTGGVKMVYNGEPDSEGKCGSDRGPHVGYGSRTAQTLSSSYMYGTDYIYDEATKTFTLSGDTETATWNDTTNTNLIGKYTCQNIDGSCTTLYYVDAYMSNTSAYIYPINSTTKYSNIGSSKFNSESNSPADVGYMYNKRYPYSSKSSNSLISNILVLNSQYLGTSYYYADSVEWNTLSSRYNLVEPYRVNSSTDYPNLVGKYTFINSTETYTNNSVYYIAGVKDSYMYCIRLTKGQELSDADIMYTFSDSLVEDETGKQILNPETIKKVKRSEWLTNYSDYEDKYLCSDIECTDIYYIKTTSETNMKYYNIVTDDYIYGNTFTYDEQTGKYTLSGKTQHFYDWDDNYSKLGNMHYTCWNTSGMCDKISYIYSIYNNEIYYMNLENGTSIEKALEEMLSSDNVNVNDSIVKNLIDLWYSKNMIEYNDYLEDTVWCNDRSIRDIGSWDPNSEDFSKSLRFGNLNVLTCLNESDRFTVSKENGNGVLTYPVGLITYNESSLAGTYGGYAIRSSEFNLSLTPDRFYSSDEYYNRKSTAHNIIISGNGGTVSGLTHVSHADSVRPTISLHTGIKYDDGDGTTDHPYIIDMDVDHNKYNITMDKSDDVYISYNSAYKNQTIEIKSRFDDKLIKSFKLNGKLVKGNKLVMPEEDVIITDVTIAINPVIESEHNPYPNSLNSKVYGERTFGGATSLTVELDYQTESTSYDWIYLYDSTGKQYGKYGGSTRKTETITIPGDYVKVVFRTDGSSNNYYGFKATITPNYK